MSHDTSRHTEWADVICADCGRTLRGAKTSRGEWSVRKHKRPNGKGCLGYLSVRHKRAPT